MQLGDAKLKLQVLEASEEDDCLKKKHQDCYNTEGKDQGCKREKRKRVQKLRAKAMPNFFCVNVVRYNN